MPLDRAISAIALSKADLGRLTKVNRFFPPWTILIQRLNHQFSFFFVDVNFNFDFSIFKVDFMAPAIIAARGFNSPVQQVGRCLRIVDLAS